MTIDVINYTEEQFAKLNSEQLLQLAYDTKKQLSQVSFGGSMYEFSSFFGLCHHGFFVV